MTGVVSSADTLSFECVIRDITEKGARLFARRRQFPREFHLIHVRNRTVHTAKVVWKKESEVGVEFLGSIPIADIMDPALSHLARLWMLHAGAQA